MPLLGEGRQQATADGRDRELEDEQRDGDREDAVGEGVEAVERQDIGCSDVRRSLTDRRTDWSVVASSARRSGSIDGYGSRRPPGPG